MCEVPALKIVLASFITCLLAARSAGTPRASCAAIVCGPVPCDAPDPVATLMPLVRSNSGNSCSYALLNPPDIKTFSCAAAATGHNGSVAKIKNENVFMVGSSPGAPRARDGTIADQALQDGSQPILILPGVGFFSSDWICRRGALPSRAAIMV